MTITIPDDILAQAGLTERDALIEFACRLYDADRLTKPAAARLAGLDRVGFEIELRKRGIAVYRPTPEDFRSDMETLRQLRETA
jgi:predicted HTH domain antitoxin